MSDNFSYCPVCQLPLQAIAISPDAHVSMCISRNGDGELEECPQGIDCLRTDLFHYRDYSHNVLAAYRSSTDFVPPNIKIKPSPRKRKTPLKQPKRSSPRKNKTPEKSNVASNETDAIFGDESDTDDILVPSKKPRKNLNFSENPNKGAQSKNSKSNSGKSSRKKGSKSKVVKSLTDLPAEEDYQNTAKENGEQNLPILKKENTDAISSQNDALVNVSLNSADELTLAKSKSIPSISSISVINVKGVNFGSDNSETASEISCADGLVKFPRQLDLKEPELTLSNEKLIGLSESNVQSKANLTSIILKEPILTIERLNTHDGELSQLYSKEFVEKDVNSPAPTVHSCSEYHETGSSISSVSEEVIDGNERLSFQEVNSPISRIKSSALLTSSSESDVPVSTLVPRKPNSVVNNVTRKKKVTAGMVLRTPNKIPERLNGLSPLNNNIIGADFSDNESDSGKSSAHTDASYVPSEKTNSSIHSDSALSVKSTDQLSASSTSISTSSDSYTDARSSDPSYSGESDITSGSKSLKTKSFPKNEKKFSPKKKRLVKPLSTLSEESSSTNSSHSEISMREKLLFGSKKLSPKRLPPKFKKSPAKSEEIFKASTLGLLDNTDSDDKSEWHSLLNKMRNGCYPSDLKIDSEDSLTVVSSCSGSDTSHSSAMLPTRQCPFYKRIPDTPFAVDAFQYWNIPGVKIYFLSHFHSDHYIGLKKSFSQPIYCSQITANLVRMKLRVDPKWLRVIEVNQPQIICGVEVTALEANHCPGSVMFLFSLTNGQNYLHVGDFRASKAMTFDPLLRNVSISKLYLDTTYCSPQYCFPTQEEVIARVVEIVKDQVKIHPKTLVVCGSYTIGKEKVFLGIAEALDWQIWVRPEKQRVFGCLNDPRINSRLVKDFRLANVHVLPMGSLQIRTLQEHLEHCVGAFTHVIGVKPTGWELNSKSDQFKITSRDNITIYGVPYSEHSSFAELRDFVQFLQPHEIVPTVNVGSAASRSKMNKYFSEWLRPQTDGKSEKQTKVSQFFKITS